MNRNEPVVGSGSSGISTPLFVMNTDAKTVTTSGDDPYLQIGGTPGEEGNIRPIIVPDMGYYLELNVAYIGTAPTADQPKVRVYGEVPMVTSDVKRYWPVDVDANMSGSVDSAATDTSSFWVPLIDWDSPEYQTDHDEQDATNVVALNPDAVVALDSGDGTPGIKLGVPRRVAITGCTRLICTIHTASDSGGASVIIGRITG
tara:strand:+ start:2784 stop:3389 length:606 start_codon:yes stop_codon:yes gene_type:complete